MATAVRKPATQTADKLNFRTWQKGSLIFEVYRLMDYEMQPDEDPDRYAGTDPEERAKYEAQDAERIAAFNRGDWVYMGVVCDIRIKTAASWVIPHQIGRASTWGIESDSGENYFAEMEKDVIAEAIGDLEKTIAEVLVARHITF